jgi:hypothetical protein
MGRRLMESIEQFLTKRLKLKVNKAKSAVARRWTNGWDVPRETTGVRHFFPA